MSVRPEITSNWSIQIASPDIEPGDGPDQSGYVLGDKDTTFKTTFNIGVDDTAIDAFLSEYGPRDAVAGDIVVGIKSSAAAHREQPRVSDLRPYFIDPNALPAQDYAQAALVGRSTTVITPIGPRLARRGLTESEGVNERMTAALLLGAKMRSPEQIAKAAERMDTFRWLGRGITHVAAAGVAADVILGAPRVVDAQSAIIIYGGIGIAGDAIIKAYANTRKPGRDLTLPLIQATQQKLYTETMDDIKRIKKEVKLSEISPFQTDSSPSE